SRAPRRHAPAGRRPPARRSRGSQATPPRRRWVPPCPRSWSSFQRCRESRATAPGAQRETGPVSSGPFSGTSAGELLLRRGTLLAPTGGQRAAALVEVAQQVLEVALEPGAVVPLEHAQLVDLALQQGPFLLELGEGPVRGLLRLPDDPGGLHLGVGDEPLTLLLTAAHVVVV